jgi:hypothetical protein
VQWKKTVSMFGGKECGRCGMLALGAVNTTHVNDVADYAMFGQVLTSSNHSSDFIL